MNPFFPFISIFLVFSASPLPSPSLVIIPWGQSIVALDSWLIVLCLSDLVVSEIFLMDVLGKVEFVGSHRSWFLSLRSKFRVVRDGLEIHGCNRFVLGGSGLRRCRKNGCDAAILSLLYSEAK